MDVTSIAGSYMAQSLQSVQSAVKMSMLSKAMNQDGQTMSGVLEGLQAANPVRQSLELAVNPNVGSQFDMSI